MKQEYKEMMIKYLENNPGIEITSNPIGWDRNLQQVGDEPIYTNDSISYGITFGKLESAMIALHVREKIRNYTSYKMMYNKDEKAFVGKVKRRYDSNRFVDVQVRVPEHMWFNTVDFVIDINGKSTIKCDVKFNIKNGIIPKDMEDIRKRIEHSVCRQFMEQLKGEGRMVKQTHRRTVTYADVLKMEFVCDLITHNNEDITIKL